MEVRATPLTGFRTGYCRASRSHRLENHLFANGHKKKLKSRYAAVRVTLVNRDFERSKQLPEQSLLIEWPKEGAHPTKYWLQNHGGHGFAEPRGNGLATTDLQAEIRRGES